MKELRKEVADTLEQGIGTLFARPVTAAGLQLLRSHGFRTVDANAGPELNRVYRLEFDLPPVGDPERRSAIDRRLAFLSRRNKTRND
ncbi:MAG: hypothetical protein ACRD1B_03615 [Thermoanaerobaculia bacterium]